MGLAMLMLPAGAAESQLVDYSWIIVLAAVAKLSLPLAGVGAVLLLVSALTRLLPCKIRSAWGTATIRSFSTMLAIAGFWLTLPLLASAGAVVIRLW